MRFFSMDTQSKLGRLSEELLSMHRSHKVVLMVAADAVALPFCFLASMLLRIPDLDAALGWGYYPYVLTPLVTIVVFGFSGLYHAVIRYIDKNLLARVGTGLALVIAISFLLSYFVEERALPRGALVIYWFVAFSYVVSSRLSMRAFLRSKAGLNARPLEAVGIFGAGEAGVQLATAMRNEGRYLPVCFFDDKQELHRQNVAGLKVFHTTRVTEIARQTEMRLIVLALPSAPPSRRRKVMHAIRRAGVAVKTLNSLIELSDDPITTRSIRELKIEDLLGREPVPPRPDLFAKCVQGKNVLVTGAGGSIGSELCRQIMTLAPRQLHLLDHSEYALYAIEHELRERFPDVSLHSHLGSVCDARLVERLIRLGRIETVYHAAAYKHVPVVERNMAEGIRNNVVGAQVVAAAAKKNAVGTCVLISTDKAVRPTNIMGASKRIAELVFQAAASTSGPGETVFCMVRLGNVLGSSGSVIPLFQRQIECNGPLTITHPDVVRYFMLIPEAAQLVIQAGAMAQGGDLFVLDMGEPVRIVDLARTMIAMAGLQERSGANPDGDIEIRFIGLRPGEKLYEELLIGDDTRPSTHPRIMCANEYAIHPALLEKMIDRLMVICRTNDAALIKSAMQAIVTEYASQPDGDEVERHPMTIVSRPIFRYRRLSWNPHADVSYGEHLLRGKLEQAWPTARRGRRLANGFMNDFAAAIH